MKRAILLICVGALCAAVLAPRTGARVPPFPDPAVDSALSPERHEQSIVLAGGCFWGVQAVFQRVRGALSVTSGYAGGVPKTARYDLVSTGTTGHAESVRVVFDASQITTGQLLKIFFHVAHDPTELN